MSVVGRQTGVLEITLIFSTVLRLRVAVNHVEQAVPVPDLDRLLARHRHVTSPNPLVPMAMKEIKEEVQMALAMTHVNQFRRGEKI
jgi:predicted GNAT family N-acyltransferase